jgi:hypothetical protein
MTTPTPYSPVTTPDELAIYLGLDTIATERAVMLIADAQALCEAIVKPLPAGAKAIVRRVAARAYLGPVNAVSETIGPYTVHRGTNAGVYLTAADRRALRGLGGGGGAFSIDLTPPDAMTKLPPWDTVGLTADIAQSGTQ